MFAGYGCAVRDYAFFSRSGRLLRLNNLGIFPTVVSGYLSECESELDAAANDVQNRSAHNAYGTSLPFEAKGTYLIGWYFSSDTAFDLAVCVAKALKDNQTPNPDYMHIFNPQSYVTPHFPNVAVPWDGSHSSVILDSANWSNFVTLNTWHGFRITVGTDGVSHLYIDGVSAGSLGLSGTPNYGRSGNWTLTIGNFDGDIDYVRISKVVP
jgi:hypothetical protein